MLNHIPDRWYTAEKLQNLETTWFRGQAWIGMAPHPSQGPDSTHALAEIEGKVRYSACDELMLQPHP